jgi:periplasmic divalent cation tolerance protein
LSAYKRRDTLYIVIFITAANKTEADNIAGQLVKNKLAACVNIVGNIASVFLWKAKIDSAKEVLLIVKTKKSKFSGVVKLVKSIHSYEVPEIIALPILTGERKYLRWIGESVR